ncbi:MAG: succinate dehydrogenase cytochrome b subunit [Proteobacteria bacterium]|nr:succinate dehydrogenase cytochrome b subunit [Pseudomonadota bacterium]
MSWFAKYSRSSIGAKHVMAVSGLLLLLFAVVHMLGHLQMFGGQDMYNKYANFLQSLWEVKWPTRAGLLAMVLVHIATAMSLVAKNRAARPVGYAVYRPVRSTAAGRSMILTGLVILAFIVFHIVHFTLGQVQPGVFHTLDAQGRYDAYSMYVYGFQNVGLYAAYLVGILLLSVHLGHGAASWLQSLGFRHPKYPYDKLGRLTAVVLFVGYMIPPTAVLVGLIKLPGA